MGALIPFNKNAAAGGTATALRTPSIEVTRMLEQHITEPAGLLEAVENLIDVAETPCSTPGCPRPQVGQETKDALSVLGLTSTHCQPCTTALLRELISESGETAAAPRKLVA
jgi:hypothetical protein